MYYTFLSKPGTVKTILYMVQWGREKGIKLLSSEIVDYEFENNLRSQVNGLGNMALVLRHNRC